MIFIGAGTLLAAACLLLSITPSVQVFLSLLAGGLLVLGVQSLRGQTQIDTEERVLLERYQTLIENLAAAVTVRTADGKLAYCSPFTEVLTGHSLEEMYESEKDFFLSIIHPEDRERYQRAMQMVQIGEAFQVRYRFFHRTGLEMWAETRAVPVYGEAGEFLSSLSITIDVTGSIRHQRQVEEKNRDLEDLTNILSQDLREPVFTIAGMTQLLSTSEETPEEPISHINRAIGQIERLMDGVVDYSRISRLEASSHPVNLSTLLKEIRDNYQNRLEAENLSIAFPEDLPSALGDRAQLYRIFSLLLETSLRFRTGNEPAQIAIRCESSRSLKRLILHYRDNAADLPKEMEADLFRPFSQYRGLRSGSGQNGNEPVSSGLGLAAVKKYLEKLGGDIQGEVLEPLGLHLVIELRVDPHHPSRSAVYPAAGGEDS